jgi:hypothetical protein
MVERHRNSLNTILTGRLGNWLGVLAFLLLIPFHASAQDISVISGTVMDKSGAAVGRRDSGGDERVWQSDRGPRAMKTGLMWSQRCRQAATM